MIISKPPWQQHPLDKWEIEKMCHFYKEDEKHLWVEIGKDDISLVAFGMDDNAIWTDLYNQAMRFENANKEK